MNLGRIPTSSGPKDPDAYLRTDFLLGDLSDRSVRSGMIRVGAQAFQLTFLVGVGMALARLLTPDDFGVYAMVLTLTAFVDNFRDFGLPMAAVQEEDLTHGDLSALFWLTQRLNMMTVVGVAIAAPGVAWLYSEPRLIWPTVVAAGAILCQGLTLQHESVLIRRMRFRAITVIETGSVLLGGLVGIWLGIEGWGYWALIVQLVAMAVARSMAMWLASGWSPAARGSGGATVTPKLRSLLGYGAHYTGYRVIRYLGFRLDRIVVGIIGSAGVMGLYDNAFRWSRYPMRLVFSPVLSVAIAGLSRLQDDPVAYRDASRRAILPVLSVVVPALTFLAVEADDVVPLLLGSQWLDAIPYLRLFALASIASSLMLITRWLYLSSGQTRRQFHWALIYTPAMVIAVLVGARWGVYGVAVGFAVGTSLLAGPAVAFCVRTSHVTMSDVASAAWRPMLSSGLAAAALLLLAQRLPTEPRILSVAAASAVFSVAYLIAWILAPGGKSALGDLRRMLQAVRIGSVNRSLRERERRG